MGIRAYSLIVVALLLFMVPVVPRAKANSATSREYQIKAAFIYNFTKFVDWPDEKMGEPNQPVIIGVVSDDSHQDAFKSLDKEKIKGRAVQIRYFRRLALPPKTEDDDKDQYHQTIQSLRNCHVLYICGPADQRYRNVLRVVKGAPVLTIGEATRFIRNGAMINFVKRNQKVRFEVNLTAAREANLMIRSRLLKLAVRVLGKESEEEK